MHSGVQLRRAGRGDRFLYLSKHHDNDRRERGTEVAAAHELGHSPTLQVFYLEAPYREAKRKANPMLWAQKDVQVPHAALL